MNDIMLPETAKKYEIEIMNLAVVKVVDDRSNITAMENLKVVNFYLKDFVSACEPKRKELREPLDKFLEMKKTAQDKIEGWINEQKREIGRYNQEIMRIENEKRQSDSHEIQKTGVKSEFATATIKEKPQATIKDLATFLQCLLESGNISWINLIFDKPNQSKLNDFCKANNFDGKKSSFPGLSIEMIPDVKIR